MTVKYDYKVWRDGDVVWYKLLRDEVKITSGIANVAALGPLAAIYYVFRGTERVVEREFKMAHKDAKLGIATLIANERL